MKIHSDSALLSASTFCVGDHAHVVRKPTRSTPDADTPLGAPPRIGILASVQGKSQFFHIHTKATKKFHLLTSSPATGERELGLGRRGRQHSVWHTLEFVPATVIEEYFVRTGCQIQFIDKTDVAKNKRALASIFQFSSRAGTTLSLYSSGESHYLLNSGRVSVGNSKKL